MGKLKEFSIFLDEDTVEYFAGQMLSGHVVLHLSEQVPNLKLVFLIEGTASCTAVSDYRESVYKNNITMFTTHDGHAHPSGRQLYNFSVSLPTQLPSSAKEGKNAIEYWLKAKLEFKALKSFLSTTEKIKKSFHVKEIIDANISNHELERVQRGRKIPSFFANSTKLEKEDLLIAVKRGVCCPGENFKVNIQYKHATEMRLGVVKVRLNKYVHFNMKEHQPPQKRLICEIADEKRPSDKIHERTILVPIPRNTAPTNVLTNAVVINYAIHVKVEGYKEFILPVVVGTIPYKNSSTSHNTVANSSIPSIHLPELQPSAPSSTSPVNSEPIAIPTALRNMPLSLPSHRYSTGSESSMILCDLTQPPQYVPGDVFDLPPSYDEATATSSTQPSVRQWVEAH